MVKNIFRVATFVHKGYNIKETKGLILDFPSDSNVVIFLQN